MFLMRMRVLGLSNIWQAGDGFSFNCWHWRGGVRGLLVKLTWNEEKDALDGLETNNFPFVYFVFFPGQINGDGRMTRVEVLDLIGRTGGRRTMTLILISTPSNSVPQRKFSGNFFAEIPLRIFLEQVSSVIADPMGEIITVGLKTCSHHSVWA